MLKIMSYDVVIIDCLEISTYLIDILNRFVMNKMKNGQIIMICLHGNIESSSYTEGRFCKYRGDIKAERKSIQTIMSNLSTYQTENIHIVTVNPVKFNIQYSGELLNFTRIYFWTSLAGFDSGTYDLRRKYWWNPEIMILRWINDLPKYWKRNDINVRPLIDSPLFSALASISSIAERITPNVWLS
jgi:hypothetical protein